MPDLIIPSTNSSGTDPTTGSTILAHVVRRLSKRGHGLRYIVGLSGELIGITGELIGITYQFSRLALRLSMFLTSPISISKQVPQPQENICPY